MSRRQLVLVTSILVGLALAQMAGDLGQGSPLLDARWPWLTLPALGGALLLARLLRGSGWDRRAAAGAVAGVLALSLALSGASALRLTVRLYREKSGADLGYPDTPLKREAVAWVNRHAASEALLASDEPWILNLLTWRPAVVFPWARDAAQARRYLNRYRPAYVILMVSDAPGQPPEEQRLVRRLFGAAPRSGPAPSFGQGWRMAVARAGPRPGQWLLILARDGDPPAGPLPAEHSPLPGAGPAAPRL